MILSNSFNDPENPVFECCVCGFETNDEYSLEAKENGFYCKKCYGEYLENELELD